MIDLPEIPVVFQNTCHSDERGSLSVIEKSERIKSFNTVHQCFVHSTRKHILRGLHYQDGSAAQSKFITCMSGLILDYAINIDTSSEQFGKSWCFKLDRKTSLFIPKSYAHGYLTLTRNTLVHYEFDHKYDSAASRIINFFDDRLNLNLPVQRNDVLMSVADAEAVNLSFDKVN